MPTRFDLSAHRVRLDTALQQNYFANALIWLYYSDLIPERLLILQELPDGYRTADALADRKPLAFD
ncbi:MAG TPA: hypothetical protein VKS82_23560 [Streptosporangiaceae bacterium]|nr:hypothetical protein [Streptosporangiaceae bacterium]